MSHSAQDPTATADAYIATWNEAVVEGVAFGTLGADRCLASIVGFIEDADNRLTLAHNSGQV